MHSLGTTYAVWFLYTLSCIWWSLTPRTKRRGEAVHNSWCRREPNLKAREGRGSDSVAGAPSCLSISDMTTLQRQSYWFETKKQTSIYWSRCDELKCDTLVGGGGGGESVVYWRVVGACGEGGMPQARLLGQLSRILWSSAPFFPVRVSDTFCISLCTRSTFTPFRSSSFEFCNWIFTCGVDTSSHFRKHRISSKCHLQCCTL